jgi:hypothetical protein
MALKRVTKYFIQLKSFKKKVILLTVQTGDVGPNYRCALNQELRGSELPRYWFKKPRGIIHCI